MRTPSIIIVLLLVCVLSSAQEFHYYAGNLHAHSGYSDGNQDGRKTKVKTPAGCFAFASKSEHFDFLGISEHNHSEANMKLTNYKLGLTEALQSTTDKFLCLYGMEFGVIKNGGHVLIYGIDELIGWEGSPIEIAKSDYTSLWTVISQKYPEAFATLAHPEKADYQSLISKPYNPAADNVICGVAVMTGPAKSKVNDYSLKKPAKTFMGYYQLLLSLGYHVGPTVDHDNHNLTFGRTAQSRTIVLAKKLDMNNLMTAYRAMRFYASEDWNVKVNFKINGQPMGSVIETKSDPKISVKVTDDDTNDAVASIKVMYGKPGSKTIATVLKKTTASTLEFTQSQSEGDEFYYYLEIVQKDRNRIFTSPIWVKRVK